MNGFMWKYSSTRLYHTVLLITHHRKKMFFINGITHLDMMQLRASYLKWEHWGACGTSKSGIHQNMSNIKICETFQHDPISFSRGGRKTLWQGESCYSRAWSLAKTKFFLESCLCLVKFVSKCILLIDFWKIFLTLFWLTVRSGKCLLRSSSAPGRPWAAPLTEDAVWRLKIM